MKKRIFCVSTSNYRSEPTRKQNIMNRLGDFEILYADPPVSYIAPLKDPKAFERLFMYKRPPEKEKDFLFAMASPPVLPFYNKNRSINKINQRRLAKYYAKILKSKNFTDGFILWCYSPQSADLPKPLAKELGISEEKIWEDTVYDCVDRHSAYPGLIDQDVVDSMEEDLARKARVVTATAEGLFERLKEFNPNTHLVPNGADFELFSKVGVLREERVLKEGAGALERRLRSPVMGFTGALQKCIDKESLINAARAFPKGKVVIIGRVLPGVDITDLLREPNIEIAAPVPQKDLPNIMAGFDVCLNCFSNSKLSRDVSPLKFYEYLATGIPIVSTPMPCQVRSYEKTIYMASDAQSFAEKIREALLEPFGSPLSKKRVEEGRAASWAGRVETIKKIVGI